MKVLTCLTISTKYPYDKALPRVLSQNWQGENDVLVLAWETENPTGYLWGKNLARKQAKAQQLVLSQGYTHLFLVDADIVLPHDALAKLLAHQVDVIAGLHYLHSHAPDLAGRPCIFRLQEGKYLPYDDFPKDQLIGIDIIGMSCLLLSRFALQCIDFNLVMANEFTMCSQLEAHGIKRFCDTSVKCEHLDYYASPSMVSLPQK